MRIATFFLALTLAAGCGDDTAPKVMCGSDGDCVDQAQSLFSEFDASVEQMPKCCGGVCVLLSSGCDSGYRCLPWRPAFGECVPMLGCAIGSPDMGPTHD